jgi:hypothetical protein
MSYYKKQKKRKEKRNATNTRYAPMHVVTHVFEAGLFESKIRDSLRMCSPGGGYKGDI